jgi:hypothetical protein
MLSISGKSKRSKEPSFSEDPVSRYKRESAFDFLLADDFEPLTDLELDLELICFASNMDIPECNLIV